jgi:hypothetical protein
MSGGVIITMEKKDIRKIIREWRKKYRWDYLLHDVQFEELVKNLMEKDK